MNLLNMLNSALTSSAALHALSEKTGLSEKQIAPFLLSGLSATANSANSQQQSGVDLSDGFDLGDLMGMLGGMSGAQNHPQHQDAGVNGGQLLNTLLSMMK